MLKMRKILYAFYGHQFNHFLALAHGFLITLYYLSQIPQDNILFLDISDSMEFLPLSSETVEPTDEVFTYNDTSETVKHTDERCTDKEIGDITFISPPFSNPTENSLPGKFMGFDKTFSRDTTWVQFTINSRR